MANLQFDRRLWGIFGMSRKATTFQGLEIPEWFDASYAEEADSLTVGIRVRIHPENGPVPVGVSIILDDPPTATYRDAVALLKGVAMDELMHDAMLMAAGAWAWQKRAVELGLPFDGPGLTAEQSKLLGERVTEVHEQAAGMARPHRRRSTTPALLKETAEMYRKAVAEGHPPTVAVAEHFTVSHRTAARWVSQARREGHLGPAQGTRAGEALPDEVSPSE